jgi:hypothetical protein
VDNNYLDLGMNKSGFVHTLPSGRLKWIRLKEQETSGFSPTWFLSSRGKSGRR